MRYRDSGRSRFGGLFQVCLVTSFWSVLGCTRTVDTLGYNDRVDAQAGNSSGGSTAAGNSNGADAALPRRLRPLTGPSEYPNAFRDVLGKTSDDIDKKINNVFNTLFHGSSDYAFYFEVGSDESKIVDLYHNSEVRTEGMGYAMIIAVELNKQYEFDRLWRYAKQNLMVTSGPSRGYFTSRCNLSPDSAQNTRACLDPFGLQQFAMALVLAHGRWGSDDSDAGSGAINYNDDAWMLFDVMRNKEAQNGGVVDGVTNTFDANTLLVFDEPNTTCFNFTRPSLEMPAYYVMWAQATGDTFWSNAADNARGFWKSVANSDNGLMPVRAYFSGREYDGGNVFSPEGYRTQLNMTLDKIWTGVDSWDQTEANQLIAFFQHVMDTNSGSYFMSYNLDGTVIDSNNASPALISVNGDSALIASNSNRAAFIKAVWDLSMPTGNARYFDGLMYLLSLLMLSGEYRVY